MSTLTTRGGVGCGLLGAGTAGDETQVHGWKAVMTALPSARLSFGGLRRLASKTPGVVAPDAICRDRHIGIAGLETLDRVCLVWYPRIRIPRT